MRFKRFIREYYLYFILGLISILVLFIPKNTSSKEVIVNTNHKYQDIIEVFVDGEVEYKGVKYFNSNSTIRDLLKSCGKTEYLDYTVINLEEVLQDGNTYNFKANNETKYITITKTVKEVNDQNKYTKVETNIKSKININTASLEDLKSILSDKKAEAVIKYRQSKRFDKIEDIKNVSGIGDETFNAIKNYITCW